VQGRRRERLPHRRRNRVYLLRSAAPNGPARPSRRLPPVPWAADVDPADPNPAPPFARRCRTTGTGCTAPAAVAATRENPQEGADWSPRRSRRRTPPTPDMCARRTSPDTSGPAQTAPGSAPAWPSSCPAERGGDAAGWVSHPPRLGPRSDLIARRTSATCAGLAPDHRSEAESGLHTHHVWDRDRICSQGAPARRVPSSRLTTAARPRAGSRPVQPRGLGSSRFNHAVWDRDRICSHGATCAFFALERRSNAASGSEIDSKLSLHSSAGVTPRAGSRSIPNYRRSSKANLAATSHQATRPAPAIR
jgi:hypothetical protein